MQPEIQGYSIVFVGAFEPKSLLPHWFIGHQLVSESSFTDTELHVVIADVVRFRLAWLNVSVERSRLQLQTEEETRLRPLRDLAYELLRLLPDTDLRAVGLNGEAHFRSDSEEAWHAIGDRLAPKDEWEGVLKQPGLLSLAIQGQREGGIPGEVNIKVEPSVKVQPGVYVSVNDHYRLDDDPEVLSAEKVLSDFFEDSASRRAQYYDAVVSLGNRR